MNQLPLHLPRVRRQIPIARRTLDSITDGLERALGRGDGIGSSRSSEALVIRALMPIQQLADLVVFGLYR